MLSAAPPFRTTQVTAAGTDANDELEVESNQFIAKQVFTFKEYTLVYWHMTINIVQENLEKD